MFSCCTLNISIEYELAYNGFRLSHILFIIFIDKNISFLLPPYGSKCHYDLSFAFLHPALNKLLNLRLPIFIFDNDRKVVCLCYTPCRYHCMSTDLIHIKISVLPYFYKLSDAFGIPRAVAKLSNLDDIWISQKFMCIQYTASGKSKLNIRNINFTRTLWFRCSQGCWGSREWRFWISRLFLSFHTFLTL